MSGINSQEMRGILQDLCRGMGLDLVHLEVKRVNREVQIEVLTDRPRGGITIEECSRLNKRLCDEIDAANLFTEGYTVRVSSPGVDRPLRNEQDFLRVIGRPVRLYLSEKIADKLEHVGVVEAASAEQVTISHRPESLKIPFEIINKAIQEI